MMKRAAFLFFVFCLALVLPRPAAAQTQVVSSVPALEAALAAAAAGTVTDIRITQGTYSVSSPLILDAPPGFTVTLQNAGDGPVTLTSTTGGIVLQTGANSSDNGGLGPLPQFVVRGLTFTGGNPAIEANVGKIVIAESTFVSNDLGFYVDFSRARIEFVNDTFSGNGTTCTGSSCGAIWLDCHHSAAVTNVTVADNTGVGITGLGARCGAGVDTLANSIVSGNVPPDPFSIGADCRRSVADVITSSIDSDGTCGATTIARSLLGLAALAANGGLTQTMALPASSPAVNAGSPGVCPAADQRGAPRSDGQCDVGSFELGPPAISLSIDDVSVAEGNLGTTAATFTVTLSQPTNQQVTVDVATADGAAAAGIDYQTTTIAQLTFAPFVTTATVTVPVNGDTLNEFNEGFFVNLSNASNAVIAKPQGIGIIINDDPPPSLSVSDASVTETNSGTTAMLFHITLSAASGQAIHVVYTSLDGSAVSVPGGDYQGVSGGLTFLPGTPLTQDVSVPIRGDLRNEPDETFTLRLVIADVATIARADGTGTIVNDDPLPTLSIDNVIVTEGNSGTINAFLNVTLSAESGQPVTVNFATADGTATAAGNDYLASSGLLTFSPGVTLLPGDTRIRITLQIVGDLLSEPNEDFLVNLANPVNATIAQGQGTITIVNDDANTPAGSNVPVRPVDATTGGTPVSLTFSLVTQAGDTTLTTSNSGPPPSTGFQLGNPPVYFNLSTTAVFNGTVTVCIDYTGITFTGPPQLLHFENGVWTNVTSSVDTVNHIICGTVTSFSPFALFEPVNRAPLARCRNVVRSASASCDASVTPAEVNDGSSDPDGDPITLTLTPERFGLGSASAILRVTDDKGASAQCVAAVTVIDDTPPVISCPPPIVVEFSNAAGAVVTFPAAVGTDNCSVPAMTSTPSSGSAFAIGTTAVTNIAVDAAGNSSSCSFTVTVLGSRGVKENVLRDLMALRATAGHDLDGAIAALQASLAPALWIDQIHLQPQSGGDVFDKEKDAVSDLQKLVDSKKSTIARPPLQSAIDRIVKADRLLAEVAINEAIAAHGRPEKIAEAQRELARGDSAAAEGKLEKAVDDYGKAWAKSMDATGSGKSATAITTCGFVINAPGNYRIANDLPACMPPFAIKIAASDVTLRLDGHTVLGTIEMGMDGIVASGVQTIRIFGPGRISQMGAAVKWQNVNNSEVSEVTVSGDAVGVNSVGLFIQGGSDNRFTKNLASSNFAAGIRLEGATNTRIEQNVASDTIHGPGIFILSGSGNELIRNTANQNGLGSSLIDAGIDVDGSSGNRIEGNTANGNSDGGIRLRDSTTNRIEKNTTLGNLSFDLYDGEPNCDGNVWVNNTFVRANQSCIH